MKAQTGGQVIGSGGTRVRRVLALLAAVAFLSLVQGSAGALAQPAAAPGADASVVSMSPIYSQGDPNLGDADLL